MLMLSSNESEDDADDGEGGGEPTGASVYYDRAKLPLQLSSLL